MKAKRIHYKQSDIITDDIITIAMKARKKNEYWN